MRNFLYLGLAGGIALTAIGLFQRDAGGEVPRDAVALVNGVPIGRDLYERVVDGVEADLSGNQLPERDRRHVLERMIEEELLVQEAVALGMASRDRMARGYLVQAMVDFVESSKAADEPGEDRLRSFYAANREKFLRPGRIALRALHFDIFDGTPEEPVRERAEQAREALRGGEGWPAVASRYADEPVMKLPAGPMGATNVYEYLGPTATRAAFAQKPGSVGEPVRTSTGMVLIEVLQRWDDHVPPFEEVEEDVRAAWSRGRTEAALIAYVDELRSRAEISVVEKWQSGR